MEQSKKHSPPKKSIPCILTSSNPGALLGQTFARGEGQGFDWGRSFNLNINLLPMKIKNSDLPVSHTFHSFDKCSTLLSLHICK